MNMNRCTSLRQRRGRPASGNWRHGWRTVHSGFTLTELLVVIAILAVLSILTVVAVAGIARSARLSSATNTVTSALDNARAIAMRDNKLVMVAFRAVPINEGANQVIQAITCEFSGSSYALSNSVIDRFVPVQDVAVRDLPRGIKVGTPFYAVGDDFSWEVNTDFKSLRQTPSESAGAIIAVLYGPDGTTLTDNPRTDSTRIFIDFNSDGLQRQGSTDFSNIGGDDPLLGYCDSIGGDQYFCQAQFDDEPYLTFAPFLVVFDDEQAREQLNTSGWSNATTKSNALSAWISDNAHRLHFNRYTGVVMK